MCDFDGYVIPEIVKLRPVVVVSVDNSAGTRICIVAPFSTRQPKTTRPVHFHVAAGRYPFALVDQWVKGDLVAHVSFARHDSTAFESATAINVGGSPTTTSSKYKSAFCMPWGLVAL